MLALPDAFLGAGALPTLHDRYGISAEKMAKRIKDWLGGKYGEKVGKRLNAGRRAESTRGHILEFDQCLVEIEAVNGSSNRL
jgi:hypothetical protein